MSKTLLVLLVAAGVGIAVTHKKSTSAAVISDAGSETAVESTAAVPAKPTIFGKIGVRFVEGPVSRMSVRTQQMLASLKPALKKATGADGRRAAEAARKAAEFDNASREALKNAQPVRAVRAAIDARNYAKVSKGILTGI